MNRAMGALYTVEWEDGLRETDIAHRVMKEMVRTGQNTR